MAGKHSEVLKPLITAALACARKVMNMYTSSMQAIVDVSPAFAAITALTNEAADQARLEYHDGQARLSELCASHGIAVHHVQANRSNSYAPTRFNECRDLYVEVEVQQQPDRHRPAHPLTQK